MNEHSHVRIESPAFPADSVQLIELGGRETIGQLFEFHAQVVSSDPAGLDVDALIGASAALVFERGGVEIRRMGGLVASIRDSMHEETGRMVYDLWFAPRAFRLGLVETYEIFMDLSVPDIVKKKLERAGLVENQDFEFRLVASYPPREFVVQYKETDLAFVSRLLEHVGVSFFFEHKEGVDIFVLADANSGFAPLTDRKEAPFRSRGERLGVFAIESQTRMTPAQYIVKDYNYRTPQLALQASAPNEKGDGGHVMEYGAHFKNPDEGAVIAKIRAEELAAGRTVLDGKSDRHTFSAGAMFLLEDHPRGDMELLLTEVHHRAATSALGAGKENVRDYENSFHAIPYKTPFRPARITPKPRIHGVITGVIDAAAKGPYAELDADGRYRVRFLFDGGDAADGQASRLCRMAQPHGGGGYGMHFPLRSGVEVILTFMEGDPDRPIILGVVPNPQTPSPVTGGNGTRNIIRTGGGNEINIDDTAGNERIKLSTPFGSSVIQIGQQNEKEEGIIARTEKHASTESKQSVNTVSPVINGLGDYFSMASANDITQYCSFLVNVVAMTNAGLGAAGHAADLLKSIALGGNEQFQKSAEEVGAEEELKAIAKKQQLEAARPPVDEAVDALKAEKREKELQRAAAQRELEQKKQKLQSSQNELAKKEGELAKKGPRQQPAPESVFSLFGVTSQPPPVDPEILRLEAEIEALKKENATLKDEIGKLEAELSTLSGQISATDDKITSAEAPIKVLEADLAKLEKNVDELKQEAKKRKDETEEGLPHKAIEAIEDYAKTVGSGLVSSVGAYAGWAAQNLADKLAEGLVGMANKESARGRLSTWVNLVDGSPKFTGGADRNASLVAGENTFIGAGRRATLYSMYSTAVLAKCYATVKAGDTEVLGTEGLRLSSDEVVDTKSKKDVKVTAEAGTLSLAADKGAINAKAAKEIKLTAGADATTTVVTAIGTQLTAEVEKDACTLTANKSHFKVVVKEGDVFLQVHGEKSSLSLRKEDATLLHDGWGMKISPKSVELGPQQGTQSQLTLTDKMGELLSGDVGVVVGDDRMWGPGVFLKLDLGKYVQVKSKGVVIAGPRLDLL